MKNIKKYALAIALVIPGMLSLTNKADAAKAKLNEEKASSVNVRSEAKVGDNILGQISDTKEYEIKDKVSNNSGNWLKIDFNGKEAFVGAPWFDLIEETEVIAPSNFREKDTTSSKIIKVLNKGDKVIVLDQANNGYYKVKYESKVGYLYAPNLDLQIVQVAQTNTQTTSAYNYAAPSTQTYTNNTYSAPAQNYSNNNSYVANSSSAKEIIAQRESGGSYNARNGQYIGRYQLSASYLNGDYSPANQERVADNYVAQRYGSWENALAFWNNNGWY
ncbi:MAG: SH3 domain-containing protein [Peptoniphilaceae bacterium]|nr:SH3 domain-containing protein [Peptoniphilaceae bacterium]MDY6018542.1 SH3 domain-containing protein [Anaerococcus sp.]